MSDEACPTCGSPARPAGERALDIVTRSVRGYRVGVARWRRVRGAARITLHARTPPADDLLARVDGDLAAAGFGLLSVFYSERAGDVLVKLDVALARR